jgi:hypothetical protein
MRSALAFVVACTHQDEHSDDWPEECTHLESTEHTHPDMVGGPTPLEMVDIEYEADAVVVEVYGGEGGYELGMYAPEWSAEDCWPSDDRRTFCHRGCTELGTTRIPCVDREEDVTDETTWFCSMFEAAGGADAFATYYIGAIDRSWCAVNGPDVDHYADAGCELW